MLQLYLQDVFVHRHLVEKPSQTAKIAVTLFQFLFRRKLSFRDPFPHFPQDGIKFLFHLHVLKYGLPGEWPIVAHRRCMYHSRHLVLPCPLFCASGHGVCISVVRPLSVRHCEVVSAQFHGPPAPSACRILIDSDRLWCIEQGLVICQHFERCSYQVLAEMPDCPHDSPQLLIICWPTSFGFVKHLACICHDFFVSVDGFGENRTHRRVGGIRSQLEETLELRQRQDRR